MTWAHIRAHSDSHRQIPTVEELLNGAQVQHPRRLDATFKRAPKAKGAAAEQLKLDRG
jgi:hypothetical protein